MFRRHPAENHDFIIAMALISVLVFGIMLLLAFGFRPNEHRPPSEQVAIRSNVTQEKEAVLFEKGLPVFDISEWPGILEISRSVSGVLVAASIPDETKGDVQVALLPSMSSLSDWQQLRAVANPSTIVLITPEKSDVYGSLLKTTMARWDTPAGQVFGVEKLVNYLDTLKIATNDPNAFLKETSVANQMPYLASLFPGVPVLPIIVSPLAGEIQAQELSRSLSVMFPEGATIVMAGEGGNEFFGSAFSSVSSLFGCAVETVGNLEFCRPQTEIPVEIAIVGDIMLSRAVGNKLLRVDPNVAFNAADRVLDDADLTFGNLESVLSNLPTGCGGAICFKADQRHIVGLLKMDFTQMSVVNNHLSDYGETSWQDSYDFLTMQGIDPVGGYRNDAETVFTEVNEQKVAFLAFEQHLRPRSTEEILEQVRAADEAADHVLVSFHWGPEYQHTPRPHEISLAHEVIDAGADIIIGHHPHVLQTIETYNDGLILYSMGNFVFDQSGFDENETMVARVILEKENRRVEFTPMRIDGYFPREATMNEQEKTLMRLASWSDESLTEQILAGVVRW